MFVLAVVIIISGLAAMFKPGQKNRDCQLNGWMVGHCKLQ